MKKNWANIFSYGILLMMCILGNIHVLFGIPYILCCMIWGILFYLNILFYIGNEEKEFRELLYQGIIYFAIYICFTFILPMYKPFQVFPIIAISSFLFLMIKEKTSTHIHVSENVKTVIGIIFPYLVVALFSYNLYIAFTKGSLELLKSTEQINILSSVLVWLSGAIMTLGVSVIHYINEKKILFIFTIINLILLMIMPEQIFEIMGEYKFILEGALIAEIIYYFLTKNYLESSF